MVDDVACIVVHHKSPETLVHTLGALTANGVAQDRILIVDNGNDATDRQIPGCDGYAVLYTRNRGYAAAVNDGVAHLKSTEQDRALTLVSTHESLAAPGAVRAMREEILGDPRIAVAGPTLLNADTGRQIWSVGGRLTPTLKLPRHWVNLDALANESNVDREWLDGAFTMYRTADLENFKLDETYFLYFEETDLHTRLRRAGHRVIWVPRARVSQKSSGIPSRLLGRNLFLFHRKLYSKNRGRIAVSFEITRSIARALLTKRGRWSSFLEIAKGWREGERMPASSLDSRERLAG
ncbi:GT2 family glycosyltransferase [Microterricola gilva]|uniref:GT2 family glycosyltransferase n=1 Tax=Microterricola gilva TaxID=393267 RepID=A0A4V2GB25_9MICO|nr:GT2 family glycosyltransferase [Microterricola gilva]